MTGLVMIETTTYSANLTEHLNGFFFFLLLTILTSFFAWQKGFYSWTPYNADDTFTKETDLAGSRVLLAFALFFFMQVVFVPLLLLLILMLINGQSNFDALTSSSRVQGWFNFISILGGGAGVALAFTLLHSQEKKSVLGKSRFALSDFLLGAMAWVVSFPIVSMISELITVLFLLFFNYSPVDQVAVKHLKAISSDPLLFTVTLLTVFAYVPVVEEVLFRGFLQTWLRSKMSRFPAIGLTSFIFSLFHFSTSQGITNVELIFALFVLSCFLGFIYEKQRSIWAPIGLHAIFNGVSAMVIFKTV